MTELVHVRISEELKKKLKEEADSKDLELSDLLREILQKHCGGEAMQQGSNAAYELREGTIYQAQRLTPTSPIVLVEKKDLQREEWRKQLAIKKDKRDEEKHQLEVATLKVGLWKEREKLERGKWSPRPCPYREECGVTATFTTLPILEEHFRERHPDKISEGRRGIPVLGWDARQPETSWDGRH